MVVLQEKNGDHQSHHRHHTLGAMNLTELCGSTINNKLIWLQKQE